MGLKYLLSTQADRLSMLSGFIHRLPRYILKYLEDLFFLLPEVQLIFSVVFENMFFYVSLMSRYVMVK